jgi:hypothetical protein
MAMGTLTESVIDGMYSLEEPWQSRFLDLTAAMANGGKSNGQRPTRGEVASWLEANPALCREMRQLLYAWRGMQR